MKSTTLSPETSQSFHDLCASIGSDANRILQEAKRDIWRGPDGQPGGSRAAVLTDSRAGEILRRSAAEMFESLMQAHDAEPWEDNAARIKDLQDLFGSEVELLGKRMVASMERPRGQLPAGVPPYECRETPRAVLQSLQQYKARIQLTVTTAKNRGMMAQSIHIGAHANVGAVLLGAHQTASVSQTVNDPAREEFKTAVDALVNLVKSAPQESVPQRLEAIEWLQEAKAEADKPAPDKLKITTALSAASAAVSMVANAPGAMFNIMAALSALGLA